MSTENDCIRCGEMPARRLCICAPCAWDIIYESGGGKTSREPLFE